MPDSVHSSQFEKDGDALYDANRGSKGSRVKRRKDGEDAEFCIEKVVCEICHQLIGKCDMSKFDTPMHGSLFISIDHKHGYPPPFYSNDFEWMELRCPRCNNRPFLSKNFFYNEKGKACGYMHECTDCGQGFKTALGLAGHKHAHSGGKDGNSDSS